MSNKISRRHFVNKLALGTGALAFSPARTKKMLAAQDKSERTNKSMASH